MHCTPKTSHQIIKYYVATKLYTSWWWMDGPGKSTPEKVNTFNDKEHPAKIPRILQAPLLMLLSVLCWNFPFILCTEPVIKICWWLCLRSPLDTWRVHWTTVEFLPSFLRIEIGNQAIRSIVLKAIKLVFPLPTLSTTPDLSHLPPQLLLNWWDVGRW